MNTSLLTEPSWLIDHLDDDRVLVVDTRGQPEFESAHIKGAINLPSVNLFDSTTVGSDILPTDEIERRVSQAGIDNETWLVMYDDSGLVPSARVFWVLENLGRSSMSLLNGGFPGWISRKLPTESGSVHAKPTKFKARTANVALATREDVLTALDRHDSAIVDTRTAEEFRGVTGAHTRNGHIPGAVNIDWQQHITNLFDPTLIPIEELKGLYERAGITKDKRVITYCRTASRSSHTYFVLRLLGYPEVRNYSGSWTEWNVDEHLPIEQ